MEGDRSRVGRASSAGGQVSTSRHPSGLNYLYYSHAPLTRPCSRPQGPAAGGPPSLPPHIPKRRARAKERGRAPAGSSVDVSARVSRGRGPAGMGVREAARVAGGGVLGVL